MANHYKYIKREMKNGRWVYYYADDLKSKNKTAAKVSNTSSAQANGRQAFVAAVNNNTNRSNAAATNGKQAFISAVNNSTNRSNAPKATSNYDQKMADQAKAQATEARNNRPTNTNKNAQQQYNQKAADNAKAQAIERAERARKAAKTGKSYLKRYGL